MAFTITSTNPNNLDTGVSVNENITIIFSTIIDDSEINKYVFISKKASVSTVTGNITNVEYINYSYSIDNSAGYSILTLEPEIVLTPGTEYKVIISKRISDTTGTDFLDKSYVLVFTTSLTGISSTPDSESTIIGTLPDLSDIFTGTVSTTVETGLTINDTIPEVETWDYDEIDNVTFTFSEAVNAVDATNFRVRIFNLNTFKYTNLEYNIDYVVTLSGNILTISFATPITDSNIKILITLKNITAVADITKKIKYYEYEIVTRFDPFYADVQLALAEIIAATNADRYYIAHIIFYNSKFAQALTDHCTDSPLLTLYKQRYVMASTMKDIMGRRSQIAENMFVTEKTLAYLSIKRKLSGSVATNADKTAFEEAGKYENALATCGVLIPGAHLPPTSAIMYADSNNLSAPSRMIDKSNQIAASNALTDGDLHNWFKHTFVSTPGYGS